MAKMKIWRFVLGHDGSCLVILGPCWCTLGHHRVKMDQHGVIIAHPGLPLGLWGEKVAVASIIFTFSKTVIGDLWGSRAKSGCGLGNKHFLQSGGCSSLRPWGEKVTILREIDIFSKATVPLKGG